MIPEGVLFQGIAAHRISSLQDMWFWMDLGLVALGIFALVIVPLAGGRPTPGHCKTTLEITWKNVCNLSMRID